MATVLLAGMAMVVQDILGVLMVQAEARNRGWLSGIFDALGWGAAIITTTISVTALQGHDTSLKIAVITAVTIANVVGNVAGVHIGKKFIKSDKEIMEARQAAKALSPRVR
jgi:hypothetical protein